MKTVHHIFDYPKGRTIYQYIADSLVSMGYSDSAALTYEEIMYFANGIIISWLAEGNLFKSEYFCDLHEFKPEMATQLSNLYNTLFSDIKRHLEQDNTPYRYSDIVDISFLPVSGHLDLTISVKEE